MDKIFVDNLKVECIVGILPFEREKTQPLFVSLELETPLEEAGRTGAREKTIDCALLSEKVKAYIVKRKVGLLEELAVELCDLIEKEFKPESVKIRLNKPEAVADAQSAGIEIYRKFGVENGN